MDYQLALTALQKAMHTLYEVEPTDPFVFMLVSAILVVASLLACLIPSLRATKVDAMVTLRYE